MTLEQIVRRCAKFSGYALEHWWEGDILRIEDPAHPESSLVLALGPMNTTLREVYGRVRHWGISEAECAALVRILNEPHGVGV